MRNHILRTIASATLSLGLAAAASAQSGHICSTAGVQGAWGSTWSGTFILPTGATPAAAVGTFTTDAMGQFSGTQHSSVGGVVGEDILRGTIEVNADCTGTLTVGIYDQSGNLLRTAVWALVYDDDGREVRGIFKSLVLPNGMSVPTIATAQGKKLFRNSGQGR
ncbi:MAG TPA: hypothetical protein VLS25_13830 [Dehalococcoidia bacterium]|nr:hypothetical protein [Dehalococcoidia bacterium]